MTKGDSPAPSRKRPSLLPARALPVSHSHRRTKRANGSTQPGEISPGKADAEHLSTGRAMTLLLSNKLKVTEGDGEKRLGYWCQGCEALHHVRVEGLAVWGWNGNAERPTFTPSVLYQMDMWCPPVTLENIEQWRAAPWPQEQKHLVCHTFITDGMVQFLGDCTHALAGQTLPLPDLPERFRTPPEQR